MPKGGRKYGKRRAMRKKVGYRRGLRRAVKVVHHFKETCQLSTITAAGLGNASGILSCNLSQLNNSAQFRGLFDLYKITGVKFKFLYRFNSADTATAGGAMPTLYTAINRDPFTPAPLSIGDILNDDGVRIHRVDQLQGKGGIYIKSPKPDMSGAVTVGGVPTGGIVTSQWNLGVGSSKQYWLTTGGNAQGLDQSQVNHFGLRYLLENSTNTLAQDVLVYATLYFSMKEQD